ncbi:uncharacterized protein DNG_04035 [Cephalotrichum gorgonifer]|uniref:Uncharacterized protein n=1 Tax=Cephalotrichum gorgonifer TaxID=2041049 RepID=A0AAE8SU55_9PEZI|nr:uncharacterized protein DNG_04035 [Cephalotrichum gorgonifer]
MPPSKRSGKARLSSQKSSSSSGPTIPAPFQPVPETLQKLFTKDLDKTHVYVTHVDNKPAAFKRKIFLVPVAMNIAVALAFAWRVWTISPFYLSLLRNVFLGEVNSTSFNSSGATWGQMAWEIGRRALTFMLDLVLFIFVWPWPVEFCAGRAHGNPVRWRLSVGFREKEIYVRRSREWDRDLASLLTEPGAKEAFLSVVRQATAPSLIAEKTGYLLMSSQWDLDWALMVKATSLVDSAEVPLEAFGCLVLVHDATQHGWMCLDLSTKRDNVADERRRQVFAFRDALSAAGKEDLFYRWIEIVQFESTRPGGFGEEKQVEVAQKIRDMFAKEDIDFDEFWMASVGSDTIAGM